MEKRVLWIYSLAGHDAKFTQRLLICLFSLFDSLESIKGDVVEILIKILRNGRKNSEELVSDLRELFRSVGLSHVTCLFGWEEVTMITSRSSTRIIIRAQGSDEYRICVDFGSMGSVCLADKVIGAFNKVGLSYVIE